MKQEIIHSLSLASIENEANYLPLLEVHIGLKCSTVLADLREGRDEQYISKQEHDKFITACQSFYRASLDYVMKKMVVDNDFWIHATWVDFFRRKDAS